MAQRHVVAQLAELPNGTGRAFTVAGRQVALFNVDGRIYAIGDACPHDGGPLSEGPLEGATVVCPWHGAEFDVTCGKVLCGPAVENVESFPAFVNGDTIEVEL